MWVRSLGLGRSPGVGNGNLLQYSCWKIPWTEETGRLQSMESQRGTTEHTCTVESVISTDGKPRFMRTKAHKLVVLQ